MRREAPVNESVAGRRAEEMSEMSGALALAPGWSRWFQATPSQNSNVIERGRQDTTLAPGEKGKEEGGSEGGGPTFSCSTYSHSSDG